MTTENSPLAARLDAATRAARAFAHNPSVRGATGVALAGWSYGDAIGECIETQVRGQGSTLACGAGCAACCYQRVQINIFEAIAIVDWVRKNSSQEEVSEVPQRAMESALHSTGGRLDPSGRGGGEPCPCLDENTRMCSIYPVRPAACRVAYSEDKGRCERMFRMQSDAHHDSSEHVTRISLPKLTVSAAGKSPSEYAEISLHIALVEELMFYITKGESSRTKTVGQKTLDVASSVMTLELRKALEFAFFGSVDDNLKALIRFKGTAIEACKNRV